MTVKLFSRPLWVAAPSALVALLLLPVVAAAATPEGGTLSVGGEPLSFTSGPNVVSNAAADCTIDASLCDYYALTLDLPADYAAQYPNAQVKVTLTWDLDVDYDLQAFEGDTQIGSAGATGSPEVMTFAAGSGQRSIQINIVPFAVNGGTATGVITLEPGAAAGGGGGGSATDISGPTPAAPDLPRFHVYAPPAGLSGNTGEPSVGFNSESGVAFLLSGLKTLWATFPQNLDPALPASCDASWEERSAPNTTITSLDPIGFTDSLVRGKATNRTWIGQLGAKTHLMSYTDDDGRTWTPSEGNAPGTQGFDHQGIGSGPYPSSGPGSMIPHPLFENAFYYCSQDIAYANCTRSDDGGLTFGPSVPMYTLQECGGLHGHPRVAPDGTVYVPNPGCGGQAAVAVSEDAGLSWAVRKVPGSAASGWDPQMALASDGTGYLCFANGLNEIYMAVTKDKGVTWSEPVELGKALGIRHVAFPQAVAGDPDRASCAFLATTAVGNSNALDFTGNWYLYFANTYDGGQTYTLVNATPNDPVQGAGGIWDGGGGNYNRNLLDFNEMSIDDKGYPVYGFADGCIGSCVSDPTRNTFTAFPKIARQVAGKPLYADVPVPAEPYAPAGACLSGTRSTSEALLSWRAPENGGAEITSYTLSRKAAGEADSAFQVVGVTQGKTLFRDLSVDPSVPEYVYKVVASNAEGAGEVSNLVSLPIETPVTDSVCLLPGLGLVNDAVGDSQDDNVDLLSMSIAEPQDLDGNVVFRIKVGSLATPPPQTMYAVRFHTPADDITSANDHFVGLIFDGPVPAYVYGHVEVTTVVLATVQQYTIDGTLDAASGYNAEGEITLVLPRSVYGLESGQQLVNLTANVHTGAASRGSHVARSTNILDAGASDTNYELRSAELCLPNTPPLAALAADLSTGAAPLTVRFSAAGSSDAEDAVGEYLFDFGDGQQLTQTSATVEHVYSQAGVYRATLKVKDARGLESENVAQALIDSTATGSGGSGADEGRFGGALGLWALAGLGLASVRRRRRLG